MDKEHLMTWGEFKKYVDGFGVKDDEPIWYIEVLHPKESAIAIYRASDGEVSIEDGKQL